MTSKLLRAALLTTAAFTAIASAARAQTAPDAALDAVVITGQRAVNAKTITLKRESEQVLDTVTADNIGKLADFNAGDALKRLPGVNVTLYQGEPRFVTVRGFDANFTTVNIDGMTMATPDTGGRQVYMEVLPSDFAAHIDVVKTGAADLDGHALGGVVNFVTPSAFDFGKNALLLSGKGGVNLQSKAYGGRTSTGEGEVRASTLFGPNDQFGLLFSATYWMRDLHIPQISAAPTLGFYDAAGNRAPVYGGNGIAVPGQRQWYNYADDRERQGYTARFDWRPSDALSAHVSGFYFRQTESADRNDTTAAIAATAKNQNQSDTTGLLTSATNTVQLARLRFAREMYGVNAAADYRLADGWTANVKAGWSQSTLDNPQTFDNFAQPGLAFTYDSSNSYPIFTPTNLDNYNNLSLYKLNYHRQQRTTLLQNVYDVQGRVSHNMDRDDRGLGLAFGGKWVRTLQDNDFTQYTWSGQPYTLADVVSGERICSVGCNAGGIFLISPLLADQVWTRYAGTIPGTFDPVTRYGGTYSVREDIGSGFLMARYATDTWKLTAGLRYERTTFSSEGYQKVGADYVLKGNRSRYGDLLPSVNFQYDTGESSLFRAAYSQTIGRPRYDAQANHGGVLNTAVSPVTLSQGNPDLKPLVSDNFDLAHEWYTSHGRGLISVGAFYKRIHNEIFNFGQVETLPIGGTPTQVLVSQYRNASKLTTIRGLEATFTRDFDFLPHPFDGFGVTANATLARADFPVTLGDGSVRTLHALPKQANRLYNAQIYYERGALHGRIAWHHSGSEWDDRFSFLTSAETFYQNRFVQPQDYVDISASYDITPSLTASVNGINVTGEDYIYKFGRDQEVIHDVIGFAPSVMVGLTFRH